MNLLINEKHLLSNEGFRMWVSSLPKMDKTKPQLRFMWAKCHFVKAHNFDIVPGDYSSLTMRLGFNHGRANSLSAGFHLHRGGGDDLPGMFERYRGGAGDFPFGFILIGDSPSV